MCVKFSFEYLLVIYFNIFSLSKYVGVNLLIGTDNGLYLLDRSGNDKGKRNTLFKIASAYFFLGHVYSI